ncbi:hypothetical protein, partial [Streptomyces bohaiensis]
MSPMADIVTSGEAIAAMNTALRPDQIEKHAARASALAAFESTEELARTADALERIADALENRPTPAVY